MTIQMPTEKPQPSKKLWMNSLKKKSIEVVELKKVSQKQSDRARKTSDSGSRSTAGYCQDSSKHCIRLALSYR